MIQFIKNLFTTSKAPQSCCGGCCTDQILDLGLDDADKAALAKVADTVVVGKIISIEAHPDAKVTKVRVTKVDLGNGVTEQILCGGANIEVGQIVPVATIGTDLGGGFVISERDIRGSVSRGMICARQEIGLTEVEAEKGGIWPLNPLAEAGLGMPVNQLV